MTGRPSLKTRLFQALAEGKRIEFKRTPISADLIRTVILGLDAPNDLALLRTVSQSSLRIAGAVIEGRIDLAHMSGPGGGVLPALWFEDCRFEGGITIEGSSFAALTLKDCSFHSTDDEAPTIELSRAMIANDVLVTGARPGEEGGVCWIVGDNAVIDGNLNLDRSQFRSPPARTGMHISTGKRYAVAFKGAEIKGRMTCLGGVLADGGICIADAQIHGDGWFSGAHAIAREGDAFNGQSAVVNGALALDARADVDGGHDLRPFRASGAVFLWSARIRGGLFCNNIRIRNPDGASLILTNAEIGKVLTIAGDKTSKQGRARLFGSIHLENAEIGGDLNIVGACVGSKTHPAVFAINMSCRQRTAVADIMPLRLSWLQEENSGQFLSADRIAEDDFNRSFGRELFPKYAWNSLDFSEAQVGQFSVGDGTIIYGGISATSMRCSGDCAIRATTVGNILLNSVTVDGGSIRLDGLALTALGTERPQLSLRDAEVRRSIQTRRDMAEGGRENTAIAIRTKRLSCLPGFSLVEVLWSGPGYRMSGHLVRSLPDSQTFQLAANRHRPEVINLAGNSDVFHHLHKTGHLAITQDSAEEFLRLFCNYLQGGDGAFRIIEPGDPLPDGIQFAVDNPADFLDEKHDKKAELHAALDNGDETVIGLVESCEDDISFVPTLFNPLLTGEQLLSSLRTRIRPVTTQELNGRFVSQVNIMYSEALFRAVVSVGPDNPPDKVEVTMHHDDMLAPKLRIPLSFHGRVISSPSARGWPLGPGLPDMENLEGAELDRMRDIMRDHHPDTAELSSAIVDLEDAQCDTLLDGGGRDWGEKVQLKLNRFTYRHADDADPLLVTDRSWLGRLKRRMGIGKDPVVRARLDWLMQSYQPRSEGHPEAARLHEDYCPQPFEQLIQVARASGNEVMATTIEIEKAKIEAGRFTARMRGLLAIAGAAGAALWAGLHGIGTVLDILFLTVIFLSVTFLFDLGNIGIRVMFGYLRRPVNAVVALALWIAIGSLGVHVANSRGQLVVDVVPTASGLEPAKGRYATPVIEGRAFDAVPCGTEINEVLYAADVFIPLIDLRQESRCTVGESSRAAPAVTASADGGWWARQAADIRARTVDSRTFWEVLKAVYSVLGWLVLSLAILTFARIDRRVQEP